MDNALDGLKRWTWVLLSNTSKSAAWKVPLHAKSVVAIWPVAPNTIGAVHAARAVHTAKATIAPVATIQRSADSRSGSRWRCWWWCCGWGEEWSSCTRACGNCRTNLWSTGTGMEIFDKSQDHSQKRETEILNKSQDLSTDRETLRQTDKWTDRSRQTEHTQTKSNRERERKTDRQTETARLRSKAKTVYISDSSMLKKRSLNL